MTVHPKNQKDLMRAPVAVEIDRNLQRLRVDTPYDALSDGASRIHLDGGSVSLDVDLSPGITGYITDGAGVTPA